VTPNAFFQAIVDSELLSESQLDDIRVRLIHLDDTAQIAGALQADGTLTTYQIKQLLAGCGSELILGQYRLYAELGLGGFGRVYLARHVFMHRLVAIKVILPEFVENDRAKTWFRREMLAATQFDHPNIVKAFDANEVAGKLFLVVEYVEGQDLDKLVRDRGPLSEALALAVFRQAAAALEHANGKGMVHRDVKPGNMLLMASTLELMSDKSSRFETDQPLVKLTDFGLARLHQHRESHTLAGFRENGIVGTPEYISPEQARDIHSVDIRSDLYSLGCAWYYALTGRPPFRCATAMETVLKQIEEEPAPIESLRPELSAVTRDIVRRLLAKQPSMRYQTPQELIDAIDFEGLETPVVAPTRKSDPANPRPVLRATPLTICIPELAFAHLPAEEVAPAPAAVSVAPLAPVACATDSVRELPYEPLNETIQVLANPKATPAFPAAPPSAESIRAADEALERMRMSWNAWLALVADVVDEHINIRATPDGYRAAYADIMEANDAEVLPDIRLGIAKSVAGVVEPWFSLETLTSADRETLRGVLIHARRLNRTLFPQKDWSVLQRWLLLFSSVTAAAVIGFVVIRSRSEWAGIRSIGTLLETHRVLLLQASAVVILPWLLVPTAKAVQRCTQRPSMSDANRR
jgi:eukaryotic-like serine/threonine-protein kinase